MSGRQNQGGGQAQDTELMWMAAFILFCVVVWFLWTKFGHYVIQISFAIDWVQLYVVSLITGASEKGQGYLNFLTGVWKSPDSPGYVDPRSVSFEEMRLMSKLAGSYFRWLAVPILGYMTWKIMTEMRGDGFRNQYTLTGKGGPSLAQYQAKHWKVFQPGADFNPDKKDPNEDQAKTPMIWMRDNGIRLCDDTDGLDFEAAEEAFAKQLGEPWPGLDAAPLYVKALCIMFFFTAKQDKKARSYKEEIAIAFTRGKEADAEAVVTKLYELAKSDRRFEKLVGGVLSKHAYTNSALYGLLSWARVYGGVMASAEFRWLKAIDRSLWYGLNNCGRRSFHTEGAGIVSHYQAEFIVGGPLVEPHVDQAIDGLDDYLENQGLTDLDEFFNKKKNPFIYDDE